MKAPLFPLGTSQSAPLNVLTTETWLETLLCPQLKRKASFDRASMFVPSLFFFFFFCIRAVVILLKSWETR